MMVSLELTDVNLLNTLAVQSQPMEWDELAKKTTDNSYELCRNFAAILQMANEEKVSDIGQIKISNNF